MLQTLTKPIKYVFIVQSKLLNITSLYVYTSFSSQVQEKFVNVKLFSHDHSFLQSTIQLESQQNVSNDPFTALLSV